MPPENFRPGASCRSWRSQRWSCGFRARCLDAPLPQAPAPVEMLPGGIEGEGEIEACDCRKRRAPEGGPAVKTQHRLEGDSHGNPADETEQLRWAAAESSENRRSD